MIDWPLLKIEVKWMPRLWLGLGIIDRSLMIAAAGVIVKVGRR